MSRNRTVARDSNSVSTTLSVPSPIQKFPGESYNSISSTLKMTPPPWLKHIENMISLKDTENLLHDDVLLRVYVKLHNLPQTTPAPLIGIGDDGTVILEWDTRGIHVEVQFGNDEAQDGTVIEVDETDSFHELELDYGINFFSLIARDVR